MSKFHYSGDARRVTFTWNTVAIATMLRVLDEHYSAGYRSMAEAVGAAEVLIEDDE